MAQLLKDAKGDQVKYNGKDVYGFDYAGVVKSVDPNRRTLTMIGTDESRDRDGDIIRLSGWDLDNYKKNPVFLWAHNYGSVPIARAEKVIRRKEPPRMEFQLAFPTKGIYPFADMILDLYGEKIINTSSVGFIPFKWNPIEDDKNEQRQQYGREFVGQELLELSGCAVPSNPNAIQNALKGRTFGFKSDDLLKYLTGATLIPRPVKEDDVLNEMDKSPTEVLDETTAIQVQVPDDLTTTSVVPENQIVEPPIPVEEKTTIPVADTVVSTPVMEHLADSPMKTIEEKLNSILEGIKTISQTTQSLENGFKEVKDFQATLAKALEDGQRKSGEEGAGASSAILAEAFRQGKAKVEPVPSEVPQNSKYSKEQIQSLKTAVMELTEAFKAIKL